MDWKNKKPRIALLNINADLYELFKQVFAEGEIEIIEETIVEEKNGAILEEVKQYLALNDPEVVVWGVYAPLMENWLFYQEVKRLSTQGQCFIAITDDKKELEREVGPNNALEFLGNINDLERIKEEILAETGVCREREA
ncbi:MAG TPA: hypothetical protein VMW25_02850 [Clostridia bacterium]|nr:hypothetical protein [Clostridia bacterium]